jgi:CP family cyanate transporter-like MFS transporter
MPIRNRTAWLIALFFVCNNFVFYACISWLASMFVEAGWSAPRADRLLAMFIAFMSANSVVGFLSRDYDRRRLLAFGAAMALADMR